MTELCMLTNQDVDLIKSCVHVADSKTEAGIRTVDIHPRLVAELAGFRPPESVPMDAPAFPTGAGTARNKDNVRQKVIEPVLARANQRRSERCEPPIRAHVTPHTFRRTYITYAITAGFDIPYVQAQVGHADPNVTLAIYAQVMRRRDRDQLRAEIRALLGIDQTTSTPARSQLRDVAERRQRITAVTQLRTSETAGKGRALTQ